MKYVLLFIFAIIALFSIMISEFTPQMIEPLQVLSFMLVILCIVGFIIILFQID